MKNNLKTLCKRIFGSHKKRLVRILNKISECLCYDVMKSGKGLNTKMNIHSNCKFVNLKYQYIFIIIKLGGYKWILLHRVFFYFQFFLNNFVFPYNHKNVTLKVLLNEYTFE